MERETVPIFETAAPRTLVYLLSGPSNLMTIYRSIGINYSWIQIMVRKFEKYGIVETERIGRVKIVRLTNEGEALARGIKRCLDILNKHGG